MSNINEVEASVLRDLDKLIGRSPRIRKKEGHIITLDISINQLKELPESIGDLSNLQVLDISINHLKELPESIGTLSNLKRLSIDGNQLKELPESIGDLSNLQGLYIYNNQLKELPESIGDLSNLQKLSINGNQLKELPESIGTLSNLQRLDINGNQLKELPESIGTLSNLKRLDISINQLKELPESIGILSNLQVLHIGGNQLKELPESIGDLSNLQVLYIYNNQLKELPESIGDLSNLQKLSINGNQLKELPESIGTLSNLQVLHIGGNQLKELPESIGDLSNLQVLDISINHLKELPESIGILSNLQRLDINGNHLKELPESIGDLSNLQVLDISINHLKELPESIGTLSNLQRLSIYNNQLKELPESIGTLSNLQKLYIGGNQLKELPEFIGTLFNLQELDIDQNYIWYIPDSIVLNSKMENIKDQIENSFNFLLAFDYFPKKYSVKKGDTIEKINGKDRSNITIQKHLFSKLANSARRSYYWNFITEFSKIYLKSFTWRQWKFSLYQINSSTDKKQRELIDLKRGENTKHLDHPFRKNNFIELQMVIKVKEKYPFEEFKYLTPLIRSITITAETDRGDSIPLVFTDFYFMWNKEAQKNEFQKTVMLKFDPGYAIEPFVRIDFTNIKVEYETTLLPDSPQESLELAVIQSEIGKINKKFDLIMEFIEKNENFIFTYDEELDTSEEKENSNIKLKKSKEIFEAFENAWFEPILPTVILEIGKRAGKIGKKIGSWLGKYAEYLAAGVIVASTIPPFLQFLYKLIVSRFQLGPDWLNWDLSQISIPVVFEILTYIPLILLFVYLTYKFSRKQKIPKG